MSRCEQVEQFGEWSGLAVDGDRTEREIEFEAKLADRRSGRLGEEFDDARSLRQGRPGCGAGTMISESGQGETATAAELDLAQVAAIEGVEDLAPLSRSAVAGHPELSRRSGEAVDGLGRTLTIYLPPYSPDLNPIERLWQHLKSHYLAGFITNEHEKLDTKLEDSIRSLLGKPETLQSVCKTHSE